VSFESLGGFVQLAESLPPGGGGGVETEVSPKHFSILTIHFSKALSSPLSLFI
jgi:hypothetical protein